MAEIKHMSKNVMSIVSVINCKQCVDCGFITNRDSNPNIDSNLVQT